MKTNKLRGIEGGWCSTVSSNFRIEVFYQGESIHTSAMGIEQLRQLLHVAGHLKSVSLQRWLANILDEETPPKFTLSNRRDVVFSVTPTADAVTQGMTSVH